MNHYSEEKRIQKLFSELKHEDERAAPSFAKTLQAALARSGESRRSWTVLRFASAAVIMLVALGLAILFFRESTKQTTVTEQANRPAEKPEQPISKLPEKELPEVVELKPARRGSTKTLRRLPSRSQSPLLISNWRPPTDFLLDYSSEGLLKTIPRLGEPLIEINTKFEDKQN